MNTKMLAVLLVVCVAVITCVVCVSVFLGGVSMKVKEDSVSNTGLTVIIKNTTPKGHSYGVNYWVEKKVNDNWEPLSYVPEGPRMGIMIAYMLRGYSIREVEINWEWEYGQLDPGNYRIIKGVNYVRSPGDYDTFNIYAEFTIDK